MHRRNLLPLLRRGTSRGSRRDHRTVTPKSVHHAHSTALNLEAIQEEKLPPILDIFDVPHKLGESRFYLGKASNSSTVPKDYTPRPESLDSLFFDPSPLPMSLPPPIIFDGPARPRHPALEYTCRPRRPITTSSKQSTHQVSSGAMFPGARKPLVELYEGPARTHRHVGRPSSGNKPVSYRTVMVAVAGLFGCITLVKSSDNVEHSKR